MSSYKDRRLEIKNRFLERANAEGWGDHAKAIMDTADARRDMILEGLDEKLALLTRWEKINGWHADNEGPRQTRTLAWFHLNAEMDETLHELVDTTRQMPSLD